MSKEERCNRDGCHCKCHYGFGGLHTEAQCDGEPEKKDVWGLFDEENEAGHFMTEHGHPNIKNLKSFIKTHFIPRAEVVEKIEKLDAGGGGSGRRLKVQILDLIKTINND